VEATLRFYAELNDFLPPDRRFVAFTHRWQGRASVKDVVEALGVPHAEVDLLLINGESVDFARLVADGDRIAVYPVFEALDIGPVTRVRPEPLRDLRFVLDVHLGRLARLLRLAGFDSAYRNTAGDEELAETARAEGRVLLTRDHGLLKRRAVTHGYAVRETSPRRQLAEVARRFDLHRTARPFTRCMRCNGTLDRADPQAVAPEVPPRSRAHYDAFLRCSACRRVYWKGSHYRSLELLLETALGADPDYPR
jgi:uncharacterized protein